MADAGPVDLSGTVDDVIGRLKTRLKEAGLLDRGDGFGVYSGTRNDRIHVLPWPTLSHWPGVQGPAAWIACYAVEGDNEGWYVHVDALWRATHRDDPGRRVLLALGKEWSADRALAVANACARLLGAV